MNKIPLCLALLAAMILIAPKDSFGQRSCGVGYFFNKLTAEAPDKMLELRTQHDQMVADAITKYQNTGSKTAALAPIPLAFHFVLTQAQYYAVGQDSGIKRRVNSQIAALNRDYNGANPDKAKVPTGFKPVFANVGLQFALANMTSAYTIAPGVELRIVSSPPKYAVSNSCADVKVASTGLVGWDQSKFLNVWVASIWAGSVATTILGVTVPPSFVGSSGFTNNDLGIVLNYGTIGAREFQAQFFNIPTADRGRTLTHEMGHYFEIWHVWGDDDGKCPGQPGGYDDGIADTPPQAAATYCTNTGACPQFPVHDSCSKTGDGIMFMNYMDYVDDSAMFMFTNMQAAVMRNNFNAGGESYSLTQNPPSLIRLAVENPEATVREWGVSPNPATGVFHLSLDKAEGFKGALVLNMMGQIVANVTSLSGRTQYDIDLSAAPRGIYLVQCQFDGGNLTKKLLLQ